MNELLPVLLGGTAVLLGVAHVATSVAAALRQRHVTPRVADANEIPRISVIRPLRGIEPFSHATLQSTFRLAPAAAEVLFCVDHADDPIIPLVRRIMAAHPEVPAQLLIGRDAISHNPKLNNLAKGFRRATHAWIAFVDSNVLLPADALAVLSRAFDRHAGMVCSPPVGTSPDGFAARLECAFLNAHQARWQSAADTVGNGFAQGKTMYFHRSLLDEAGGLAALDSEAAEDAAATKLVRARGLRVRLVDQFFAQPIGRRKLSDVLDRQLRWAKLRRASFPWHFALELASGSLVPVALTGIAAWLADLSATTIAATTIGAWTAWHTIEFALTRRLGWPTATLHAVVRDAVMPVIWCRAWLSNDFTWHGHDMRVDANAGGGDDDGARAATEAPRGAAL